MILIPFSVHILVYALPITALRSSLTALKETWAHVQDQQTSSGSHALPVHSLFALLGLGCCDACCENEGVSTSPGSALLAARFDVLR